MKPVSTYADQTSENWSGYVTPAVSEGYTESSTAFTVPALTTCGDTDTGSAFWGGLDGDEDSTVEQDGVEDDCTGGSASLYAWVETYPAPQEEIVNSSGAPAPVAPGDAIVTTVSEVNPSEYAFYVENETQGWSISADLEMPSGYTGEDQTSEVITEAPTECEGSTCAQLPLTDFGSVSYGSASSSAGIYTSSNTIRIDLYVNNVEADSVGALGTGGAFTVTYNTPDHVTVTSPGNQSTTVGAAVNLHIHAESSKGAALSYAATGLPHGLSISSTSGLVSGTPTASGTYSVKIAATDTTGTSGSASFTWTVKKLAVPKPHQCGTRTGTRLEVCWSAVAHATSYSGELYKHGHSFKTTALHEVFRGLKRNTSYRLRVRASNATGSSTVAVLTVRTK